MESQAESRIVVFGGSSGIGLACVERLAPRATELWVVSRDPSRAAAQLGGLPQVRTAALDATSEAAVHRFFAGIGPCQHVIVSLAGGAYIGPFADFGDEQFDRAIHGKLRGYVHAARGALTRLVPGGSLTFITGLAARRPVPGAASLAMLNGALEALVLTLAVEAAPRRVNAVSPGTTDTPAWSRMPADARRVLFDSAAARTPLGRVASPADVAAAVAGLLDAPFVTGAILPCDGGAHLA